MEIIHGTLALSFSLGTLLNILVVAIGLGLVIFFHELGHFLVAKWCGVYVERFSIGFGQPILARKWGETEYALGWLPFGGYVKMLGQDDMDPGQMTDDQVATNPRSYTAKSVPQRMAIISAGVIMNVITGMLFFVIAFSLGIMKTDRVVGMAQVGKPAWRNGIQSGDTITRINDRPVEEFDDLIRGTTLSRGPITVSGYHRNGDTFDLTMTPEKAGILKVIGIVPSDGLQLVAADGPSSLPPAWPGTAGAQAGFQGGDTIIEVAGEPIRDHNQLLSLLNRRRGEEIEVKVRRAGNSPDEQSEVVLKLPPMKFSVFGLRMGMGRVEALRNNSPAMRAGIQPGDRIATVNGRDVGNDLDPYRLTELFSENAGNEVSVTVTREVAGGAPETMTLHLVPDAVDPWSEPPVAPESPLSIPSIGLAYHLVPTVFSVKAGSVAAEQKINKGDSITRVEFVPPPGETREYDAKMPHEFDMAESKNWEFIVWLMQERFRTHRVKLTVKPASGSEPRVVELQPQEAENWEIPNARGLNFDYLRTLRKAADVPQAFVMGGRYTISCIEDIYLMLRGLFTRDISPQGLSGPIGIAKTAFWFAKLGMAHFILFLGVISVNLAVINFLPIPVLDGGHMVFLLWEGIARRKPSEKIVATATYCGLVFVLGLFIFVIYLDVFAARQ